LRKIIKDLFKEKDFFKNYIYNGLILQSKINVNNIYKLLKKYDVVFENVEKDVVLKLLLMNSENKKEKIDKKSNEDNNSSNLSCNYNSSTNQSVKENKDNIMEVEAQNIYKDTENLPQKNNIKKINNSKIQLNRKEQKSQNKFINFNFQKDEYESNLKQGGENSFVNQTVTESSHIDWEKNNSNLNFQKDLFDKDDIDYNFNKNNNLIFNNDKRGKFFHDNMMENDNDLFSFFMKEDEEIYKDCSSYLSI